MSERIGQALVTDPGGAAGGGYTLVAASPAVASGDADFLAGTSQVTDYLHLEERPGPYLSFYDLPSGAWAFARRFVEGKRRGDYNRVVAHTLVLPRSVLDAVAWDPWQLLAKGRFRPAGGGEPLSFPAAGARLAKELPSALPDLELVPPDEPLAELAASLERRRDFLRQAWGTGSLRARLGWALGTLAAGDRPLLPQTTEDEQLLGLAWLLLPASDRRRTRWTTHLAVSAEDLFQLAVAPSSTGLVEDRKGGWRAPEGAPAARQPTSATAAVETLVAVALGDDEEGGPPVVPLGALASLLAEPQRSLLGDPGLLRREIESLGLLEHLPPAGHETVAALLAALRKVKVAAREDATESGLPEPMVLRTAAATARNVVLVRGEETTPTIREVRAALEDRLRLPGLFEVAVVRALAAGGGSGDLLPWAVALVLERLPALPDGLAAREELAAFLRRPAAAAVDEGAGDERQEALRLGLLARLTGELVRGRSAATYDNLMALAEVPRGILRVRDALRRPPADLEGLFAVVELARGGGHEATAATIVREDLVPLLARLDARPEAIRPAQVSQALGSLEAEPAVLGEAIRTWRGDLFDLALAELGSWPAAPATAAARTAFAAPSPELPERPSLVGVAGALADRGVPTDAWLPLALAEAAYLDRLGTPDARRTFVALAARHSLAQAEAAAAALAAAAGVGTAARACHRALVQAALPGLPGVPREARRDLPRVFEAARPDELVEWASVAASAAAALDSTSPEAADTVRWSWWRAFAEQLGEVVVPAAAVDVFRAFGAKERAAAVERALPKLRWLGDGEDERALLGVFEETADVAEPPLAVELDLALVQRAVERHRLDLDRAVARTYELTWRQPERFRRALLDLLPSLPHERAERLLALALSPRVWPGAKAVVTASGNGLPAGQETLAGCLDLAGDALLGRLPPFTELAADAPALLVVARHAGDRWEAAPTVAERLLRDALDAGRGDYAGVFLARAEARRQTGFLRRLGNERELGLLRRLAAAAGEPWGWSLWPLAPRIRRELERASGRSRENAST